MATLSNSLIIEKRKYQFGVAFNLLKEHKLNEVLHLADGWELVVNSNSPYLILRGSKFTGELDNLFVHCYELVQRGLDILSINGSGDISISEGSEDYFIWWNNQGKQYLKVNRLIDFAMGASVEITLTDRDGNTIEQEKPKPIKYHESLRYFKLSQITEDLFDAFRNMYLAFEFLLSLQTKRRKGEKESDWLKRGLSNIGDLKNIENLLKASTGSVVEKFHKQIYVNVRCSIFHAKDNGKKLIPQNLEDRKKVARALEILTQVILGIVSKELYVKRENAIITNIGFSHMLRGNNQEYEICLSHIDQPLSTLEESTDKLHKDSFKLPANYSNELSLPGTSYFIGSLEPSSILNTPVIKRFSFQIDQNLFSVHQIHGGLTMDYIDELQIHLGYRLENKNLPKNRFQY